VEPDRTSYRPIRAIGLLLILEVIGLVALGAYEFAQVDWQRLDLEAPPPQAVIEVAAFAVFAPPAVLTLLSGLSFLLLRRRGWLLAAIAQGLSLAACLWLYTLFQPGYVYPIMAYCIVMILYLNSHDVRVVFRRGREAEQGLGEAV
jgi:hypothetical protein